MAAIPGALEAPRDQSPLLIVMLTSLGDDPVVTAFNRPDNYFVPLAVDPATADRAEGNVPIAEVGTLASAAAASSAA